MADEYDEFLARATQQAPSQGPVPVTAGSGVDEYDRFLEKQKTATPTPVAPTVQPEVNDPYDAFAAKNNVDPKQTGYIDLLSGGVQRGVQSLKAAPDSWKGVMAGLRGDLPLAHEHMRAAEEIEKQAPEGVWKLENVSNADEFARWLTEKFGENAINILAAIPTGVVGGLTGALATRGLVSSGAIRGVLEAGKMVPSAKALQWGATLGGGAALYPLTVGLETPGTAQEQFKVTGDAFGAVEADRALKAGLLKGMFELYTPMSIARALVAPGYQLGKTFVGGIGKGFLKEAATEAAQEAIDIYARQLAEPGYSYFKNGPTLMPEGWGEGAWRLAEAGVAGGFLGGVFGGAGQRLEQRIGGGGYDTSVGAQRPGDRYTLPSGEPKAPGLVQESRGDLRVFPTANEINKQNKAKDINVSILPGIKDNDNDRMLGWSSLPDGHPDKERLALEWETNLRAKIAQNRRDKFHSIEGGIGPVTQLRDTVIPKKPGDKLVQESRATDPRDDVLGVGTLLSTLPRQESREAFLDMVEANTPRYIETANSNRLWTDTELELEFATNRPQSEKPRLLRVKQDMLQPGAMTALISDLAPPGSERIYFLQGVNPQERQELLQQYTQMYPYFQKAAGLALKDKTELNKFEEGFKPIYDKLLTAGMRVIPSRGAGFYYNGVVEGEEVKDLKSTQRSKFVAIYNPLDGKITPFGQDERFFPHQLQSGNIVVSVDKNKVNKDQVIEAEDGSFTLKGGLDPTKLTPGIGIRFAGDPTMRDLETFKQGFAEQGIQSESGIVDVEDSALAARFKTVVDKVLPAVDKILDSLGIDGNKRIAVLITDREIDQVTSSIAMYTDQGIMLIMPQKFMNETSAIINTGNLESTLLSAMMHELGHQLTYWYWRGLPVEVQDKLHYAHQKSLLSHRMGDTSKTDTAGIAPGASVAHSQYYLTFPEWLAEQFRRWATSNAQPVSFIEQSFKEGSQKLEKFYRGWEQTFGTKSKVNLSEPSFEFSAFMDYLHGFSNERNKAKQWAKQYNVQLGEGIADTPIKLQLMNQVKMGLMSLEHMRPQEVGYVLNESLNPHILPGAFLKSDKEVTARWLPDLNLIEVAVGVMEEDTAFGETQQRGVHELIHAYEKLGILRPKQAEVLMQDIRGHERELGWNVGAKAALRTEVNRVGDIHGWDAAVREIAYQQGEARELRAYYLQKFVADGKAFSKEGGDVLTWLMEVTERIRNFIKGLGFQSRADVRRAIFSGEMVARREIRAEQSERAARSALLVQEASSGGNGFKPYQSWQVGDMRVGAMYENIVGVDKQTSKFVVYQWVDRAGKVLGVLELSNKMPKGFNIEWVENQSDRFMLASQMIVEAEKDLRMSVKPSGELTEAGFKQAQVLTRMRGQKGLMDLYTPVKLGGITFYHSPNKIQEMYYFWLRLTKDQNAREQYSKMLGSGTLISQQQALKALAMYRGLYNKLPESIWSDPRLEQMFNLRRNNERDEVQGSLIREGRDVEESKLLAAVAGTPVKPDVFREAFELKQKLSQGENARASGLSYEMSAPASGLTLEIRNIFKKGEMRKEWEQRTGYGSSQSVERELINVAHEGDRIGKFTKYWWHIGQLVRANENAKEIQGLLNAYQHGEMMFILQNKWMQRADETAKLWLNEVKGTKRKEGVTNTLFALSEMDYLLPAERAAGIQRLPSNWDDFLNGVPPVAGGELFRLFKKHGLDPRDYGIVRRVNNDFRDFLNESEAVSLKVLAKKFAGAPAVHAAAVAELTKDMAVFRSKPYFPMMRFGEFTIGVRENGKVVAAYAYATQRQRDAAIEGVRNKFPVGDIQVGRVAPNVAEFMSLPGPLLKIIKEDLFDKTGKTSDQIALIDVQQLQIAEFELLHSPDRTFRKRWMPAHGIPGHSMDAFRAYNHYFMYGSRYLSRLALMDELHADLAELRASINKVGNYAKRAEIVSYVEAWLKYILEPGRDSGKFRAVVSLWFLGFSPAAAGMNYTQSLVTLGTLGKRFGYGKAYSTVVRSTTPYSFAKALGPGKAGFERAYTEMKRQGYIDVGQAPELAAYAEGYNLGRLTAQTKSQEFWRKLSYAGMKMFQITEMHVRNQAMRHAWLLAMQNPNTPRLNEIDVTYPLEIARLVDPVANGGAGLTHKEAVAFMFAKEIIKETQFVYSRQYDPVFMRGKQKDLLIFFKYTHGMLSQTFGRNGPTVHMLLVFAFLYGLSGVPFAEDGNEVIKALAQRLFGKDVDLLREARKLVKSIVRDGPFDKTGPDLAMHGISRYGFGLGLLPQHWGAPRFDASANGSMGRVVPGLSEMAHGLATGKKFSDAFAESAQRAAGAGYGTLFTLMQFLMEGPSAESKKWEQLLQRELKALAKVYRYGFNPQAETTRGGAKIVNFNMENPITSFHAGDPNDVATVLAQAMGFTPTKVSEKWEGMRAVQEDSEVYKMRRATLVVQLDKAIRDNNPAATEDVLSAIRRYNDDVRLIDPKEQIDPKGLRQGLKQRETARQMQEQTLARNKRELMITDRLRDLYPGLQQEKVK